MKVAKAWVLVFLLLISSINVYAWPIPDTGQKKCFENFKEISCPAPGDFFYGQDGNYTINLPSYKKLDAAGAALPDSAASWVMVRDNVTGLIWENKTNNGTIHDGSKTFTWCDKNSFTNGGVQGTCGTGTGAAATGTEAYIKALNDANFGGFSDWRMPTPTELGTITDVSRHSPAINTAWFPNTVSSSYWSFTTYARDSDYAWGVDFYYGNVSYDFKPDANAVRAVRGGQSGTLNNLVTNSDGTVTDKATGLMWLQDTVSSTTWHAALAYAEGLTLAGYSDWRLPTKSELQSIVDFSRYNPAIDETFFPGAVSSDYWSSTPNADLGGFSAWGVDFSTGSVDSYGAKNAVRAVRGGSQSGTSFVVANAGSKQVAFDKATLDASASQGNIISWNWTLTHQTNPAYSRTATGQKPNLDNLAAGFYDVCLTVSDGATTSTTTNLLAVAGTWDVNGDGKLGLAEAIYILQTTAGVR